MLKDTQIEKTVKELGFNRLDLGDQKMISKLQNLYDQNYKDKASEHDMNVTHNGADKDLAFQTHLGIEDIVSPYLERHFKNYKILASHFVIKKAKSQTGFSLHQDWNVLDENEDYNLQVWIPLSPSYPENGGICFLPQSHLFYNNYRSGSAGIPMVPIEEKLHAYLSFLRLFPGEAAIFHSKTFHGSFINSSPVNRVAVLVNIVPKDAQALYYHQVQNEILAYPIDTKEIFENLPSLEKGILPFSEKPSIASFPLNETPIKQINEDALIKKVEAYNLKQNLEKDYEHKILHILRDKNLEKEINHKGYAIIDFLDEETLKIFRNKFNEVFPDRSIHPSLYSSIVLSNEKRKQLHDFTLKTVEKHLNGFFQNHVSPISLFYTRKPDGLSELDWHGDPSITMNPHTEAIYAVWCPLYDMTPQHGTLRIVPGSHRLTNKLSFTYDAFKWPFENKRKILEEFNLSFSYKAGQALIYDARMFHASAPNQTDIDRDNIMIHLHHAQVNNMKIHTYNTSQNHCGELYKQDLSYFHSKALMNHKEKPDVGEFMGDFYLYEEEVQDEFIYKHLNRFV